MHHDFFDKFRYIKSFWSRIPILVRFFIAVLFVVYLAVIPFGKWELISVGFLTVLLILFLSRLPLKYFFSRTIIVSIPALMITLSALYFKSIEWVVFIYLKSWFSAGIMVILISTVSFPLLLMSLRKIGMPSLLVSLLGFVYRYSFLLIDELESLQRAYKARAAGKSLKLRRYAFSNIIGTLFIRSLGRSENVYNAMLSRGFNGYLKYIYIESKTK